MFNRVLQHILFLNQLVISYSMIDKRPLRVKALEVAIKSIQNSITPSAANIIYKKWEVFHDDRKFKQAIQQKQLIFKNK